MSVTFSVHISNSNYSKYSRPVCVKIFLSNLEQTPKQRVNFSTNNNFSCSSNKVGFWKFHYISDPLSHMCSTCLIQLCLGGKRL